MFAQAQFRVSRETGALALRDSVLADLTGKLGAEPSDWASRALLGELLYNGQLREQADRDAPDTAEAWYLRTFTTLNLDDAWRFAEAAVERHPSEPLALLTWERLAYLSLETRHFDAATAAAQKLVTLGRDRFHWMLFEGKVLVKQRRYEAAIEQYGRVAALFPDRPQVYRYRGVSYFCLKEYDEAIQEFSVCLKIASAEGRYDRMASYLLATPLWIRGRTEEAAEAYRALRGSQACFEYANTRLFLVLQDRAGQLEDQGQVDLAQGCREEARSLLAAGPGCGETAEWPGKIFECLTGKLSPDLLVAAAGGGLKRACEAYYYAGERCLLDGDVGKAREWFQRCVDTDLALDPENPSPLDPMNEYHLAVWRLDQLASAEDAAISDR